MTWLLSLKSKILLYALAAAGIATIVVASLAKAFNAGSSSAKLNELQENLKARELEAKVRAEIDAATASARRKQLHDRWAKR